MKFFKSIQILDIKKYALNKPGFIDAEKFHPNFKNYIKNDDFSFLEKVFSLNATNILSGNSEIFNKGELIKTILASAAIPGIFAPVKLNDSYYIDGGSLNNFPVELLKTTCDKIIGVYVNGFDTISINDLKHSHNVVERAFKLKSVKDDQEKFNDCDLVISPKELNNYGTFDKKHLDDIFKIGYDATIKALVNNNNLLIKTFEN